jgi:hypothetical protein
LKRIATSNTKGKSIFRYRLSPETFGYSRIIIIIIIIIIIVIMFTNMTRAFTN